MPGPVDVCTACDVAARDVSTIDSASDGSIDAAALDGATADADPGVEWPNAMSSAASDPWILANHDRIRVMRPRILALNFVNARTNDQMLTLMRSITAAMREGTRHHGYDTTTAPAFLEAEIAYSIDLRDAPPPAGYTLRNSTRYPRESPRQGTWGFDYGQLFTDTFAGYYGVRDPANPSRFLNLCELSERGLVHEVWIYGDADVPDVSAAEILGIMPRYDENFARIPGAPMNRCAGNGCFDADDVIPPACTRTLRIGWVNNTRGVGCYMESLSHGIEGISSQGTVPFFTEHFSNFAGFDFRLRLGTPFDSWYACTSSPCLAYPTSSSVTWNIGGRMGTIDPYVPICNNAHFPPNARQHYDIVNPLPVMSTCRGYRQGGGPGGMDIAAPVSATDWSMYRTLAPDCTGAWLVWWWQNFPGLGNRSTDSASRPMHNWWPFLYY